MFHKLFDLENPVIRVLSTAFDLAVLNVLCLVFSLPVFSMGCAVTAAAAVCFRIIRDESTGVIASFWRYIKINFKPATQIWLLMLALGALFGLDLWYFLQVQSFVSGAMQMVLCGLFVVLLLMTLLATTYALALTALFENTVRMTIHNALLLSLRNPGRNIAVLAVDAVMVGATIYVPVFIPQLMVFIVLLGISCAIFLNCLILFPIFKPHLEKENEPEG